MILELEDEAQVKMGEKMIEEVEILDFMPRSVLLKFNKAQEAGDGIRANDIILKGCLVEPKISQQFLDSDNYDTAKFAIIAGRILEVYNLTQDTIDVIKKKVRKR